MKFKPQKPYFYKPRPQPQALGLQKWIQGFTLIAELHVVPQILQVLMKWSKIAPELKIMHEYMHNPNCCETTTKWAKIKYLFIEMFVKLCYSSETQRLKLTGW